MLNSKLSNKDPFLFKSEDISSFKESSPGILRSAKRTWKRTYKDINFEIFHKLSQLNCFYCDGSLSNKTIDTRFKGTSDYFIYNGLDRIDSALGHQIGNIVPCCKWCNVAKLNKSVAEFKNWVNKANNHINNNLQNIPVEVFIEKYKSICDKSIVSFPLQQQVNTL